MLSPSMITNSNGKTWRALSICGATSYWGCSPVPISPIAAKRTESGLSGNLNSPAVWPAMKTARTLRTRKMRRRMHYSCLSKNLGERFVQQVYHQIRFLVLQDRLAAHDTLCQFVRSLWQLLKKSGREGC